MSYADEYAQLEAFLKADPEYARLESEISRLTKLLNETTEETETYTGLYHRHMFCQAALEDKADQLHDDGDLGFLGFNTEFVSEYLADGQAALEREKRAALVKAGQAAERWLQADEDLEFAMADYGKVRPALVQVWREKQAAKQEAK